MCCFVGCWLGWGWFGYCLCFGSWIVKLGCCRWYVVRVRCFFWWCWSGVWGSVVLRYGWIFWCWFCCFLIRVRWWLVGCGGWVWWVVCWMFWFCWWCWLWKGWCYFFMVVLGCWCGYRSCCFCCSWGWIWFWFRFWGCWLVFWVFGLCSICWMRGFIRDVCSSSRVWWFMIFVVVCFFVYFCVIGWCCGWVWCVVRGLNCVECFWSFWIRWGCCSCSCFVFGVGIFSRCWCIGIRVMRSGSCFFGRFVSLC